MDRNKLEMFAFDVLGDLIPFNSYCILMPPNKDAAVLVNTERIGVPIEMVVAEWEESKKGTEFDNVFICIF